MSDGQLLERFAAGRDGGAAAFEALVARHGPMVWGVCRAVLGDPHDADDAFQATFLILVRRAGSIRNHDAFGPWLHAVAHRVAVRARAVAARRRAREHSSAALERWPAVCQGDPDLCATLHEEIDRLPERYRVTIVLCDLEGCTHAEAARQLRWPIGTVSGRLSRARGLLRSRIARRGLTGPAGVLAAAEVPQGAHTAVPPALIDATLRAAAAAASPSGMLVRGILRAILLGKAKAAAAVLLAGGVVAACVGPIARPGPAKSQPRPREAPVPKSVSRAPAGLRQRIIALEAQVTLRGRADEVTSRAFAPDGKTLATGSRDTTVKLWDVATGQVKSTLTGHSAPILSLMFTPDGSALASASPGQLKLWDVATGREMASLSWPPAIEMKRDEPPRHRGTAAQTRSRSG
jgi:RNA polymerase sigma factor (sigma-70 family)